jgi:hypothetical protein
MFSRSRHNRVFGCVLACGLSATFWLAPLARADEFSTIPAGDAIYTHLATLRQSASGTPHTRQDLTRYEAAIETARALLKINAGRAVTPPRSTLRALRSLTQLLRGELSRLDINVEATQRQLNSLLDSTILETRPAAPVLTPTTATKSVAVPLSQRLRVYSALSAVARDADDPFNDASAFLTRRVAPLARPGTLGAAVNNSSALAPSLATNNAVSGVEAGAALDLTNWMQLKTRFTQNSLTPDALNNNPSLRSPLFDGARSARSVGTGLDISVRRGVTFSGNVAHITALDASGDATAQGTRIGGGLKLSAWQNRLSLGANLSRLVPEDAQILPSTAAELNLGVGTDRLQLSLLYQAMFSAQNTARSDRVLSGGISVKF